MKRVYLDDTWPASWKDSYPYDLEEVYGVITNLGYAYAYDERRTQTLRLLTSVLDPGARILDVAAAQGNFSLKLAEMGYNVTWNDLRAELEGYVRLKHEYGTIDFWPGNVFDLMPAAYFDAVLMTEVIEHVAHPDKLLQKISTFVKPGGYVVITTPNGEYFRNGLPTFSECPDPTVFEQVQFRPNSDGHIFLLHLHELFALGSLAGLTVDKAVLFTNPLSNGHIKLTALLRLLPRTIVSIGESTSQRLPLYLRRKVLVQMGVRFQRTPKL